MMQTDWPAKATAVLAAVIGVAALVIAHRSSDVDEEPAESARVRSRLNARADLQDGIVVRNSSRLLVVEFSDFACSYCAQFARATLPILKQEYFDTGKAQFAFRHYPTTGSALSRPAAIAAECARRTGRFWRAHEDLFAGLTPDQILTQLGSDARAEKVESCVTTIAPEIVERDIQLGRALGVRSTPFLIIGILNEDGRMGPVEMVFGAKPVDEFRRAIERLLASLQSNKR